MFGWLETVFFSALWEFLVSLLPWILISIVAPLIRYRLDMQLWLYNKEQHEKHKRPKFAKYRNSIINCMLIVLLAGLCKASFTAAIGVAVVSNVIMIIFSAVQVTKCLNTYLKIENVGFKISIFKLFKKSKLKDVIEKDDEAK